MQLLIQLHSCLTCFHNNEIVEHKGEFYSFMVTWTWEVGYKVGFVSDVNVVVYPQLTCLRVEHQNVGSRPEQLLEVLVLADLLNERGHLHRLQQQRHQPHLDEHTNITTVTKVGVKGKN